MASLVIYSLATAPAASPSRWPSSRVFRIASAAAPFMVGSLADSRGFGAALAIAGVAFAVAAAFWIWIPETKGRALA